MYQMQQRNNIYENYLKSEVLKIYLFLNLKRHKCIISSGSFEIIIFCVYLYMAVKPLSREEFRKRYLKSLEVEAKNDAKNLAANQLFKVTGVPSQPVDTRTITEKVADIEGLKQLLRMELSKVTDTTSASQIVSQLDPDELQFAYEQFGNIEKDMKVRFRSGVPADIFVQYLRRLMEQFAITGGVPQTAEEVLEPIAESIKKGSVARRKATETATGDYATKLQLPSADEIASLTKSQVITLWKKVKDEIFRQLRDEEGLTQPQIDRRKGIYKKISSSGIRSADSIKKWIADNGEDWTSIQGFMSGVSGSGIVGAGLCKPCKKSPPKAVSGMGAVTYGQFGTHLINLHKLENGLAAFKNHKGKSVGVHRVSPQVAKVLKKIAGGSLPDYEDIDELDEDDKIFVANALNKSKLDAKVKIPNPIKSKLQRETDRFEVLKGQILAGNDSKELLKEFKLLLLRLTQEGRVPKRECNEILYELMVIGM